ncbi:hypothetical protein SDC9_175131 [bioreactor metagenome]|uniref:Uncharacterized protein n=1 Tax=bioreactor metagenome TaxID=1076179 RepID=A0A645GLD7_9ZZZZ
MQHIADGAQFARVAVALAQQGGGGVTAAIDELGEIDGDQRKAGDVGGDVLDLVIRLQQQAEAFAAGEFALAGLPDGERENDVTSGQGNGFGRFALTDFQRFPAVGRRSTILDQLGHYAASFCAAFALPWARPS